jgi:hypothetical protein
MMRRTSPQKEHQVTDRLITQPNASEILKKNGLL